jgi:branched-subunit amino acid transport protein
MKSDIGDGLKELLSFIPPAVLSALVFYGVFDKGTDSLFFSNPKIWAAVIALIVALKFKNMLLTIFSGMAIIWLLKFYL